MVGYPSATAFKRSAFLGYKDEYVMREIGRYFLGPVWKGLSLKSLTRIRFYKGASQKDQQKQEILDSYL
jgi:hypothetical protein